MFQSVEVSNFCIAVLKLAKCLLCRCLKIEKNFPKMRPLRTNQRIFTWISVYPAGAETKKWQKICYLIFTITTVIVQVSAVFANAAFVIMSINMRHSVNASFQCLGNLGILSMLVAGLMMRHNVTDCIGRLTKIYDECMTNKICRLNKYRKSSNISKKIPIAGANKYWLLFLVQANEKSEWLWQRILQLSIGATTNNLALVFLSIFVRWFWFNDFNVEHMYHPYRY